MSFEGEMYDLIVIGAGCFGLVAAKTYLQLHPSDRILVIESSNSCGGTWSKDRIYPSLKTNNVLGSYEFSDFPMDEATYGVKPLTHIPGDVLHRYLTDYAKRFGVFERILFNTNVDSIEPSGTDGWIVKASRPAGLKTLESRKMILATGLTSSPNMLSFPGQEDFDAPIFHAKDFRLRAETIKTSRNAVIVGGAKSALDIAFAYASEGVTVDLVIRPDGNGPGWLVPPIVTPLKRVAEELMHTRICTWFSPCIWGLEDGYVRVRNFLNNFVIGRKILKGFWALMTDDVITLNKYSSNSELKKLQPWNSVFWIASGASVENYGGELFRLVRQGRVRINIANVERLSKKSVLLSTGELLPADVLICATGWKRDSSIRFVNYDIAPQLHQVEKEKLSSKSEDQILRRFPVLKDQPSLRFKSDDSEPLRMYRLMIPTVSLTAQNIAFAGAASTVSTAICATLQALWIVSYLDGGLKRIVLTEREAIEEAILNSEWVRLRYPCGYTKLPDFAFDVLPYFDLLLRDLGLKNHRKANALAEVFAPYKPKDYATVVDEYKNAQSVQRNYKE